MILHACGTLSTNHILQFIIIRFDVITGKENKIKISHKNLWIIKLYLKFYLFDWDHISIFVWNLIYNGTCFFCHIYLYSSSIQQNAFYKRQICECLEKTLCELELGTSKLKKNCHEQQTKQNFLIWCKRQNQTLVYLQCVRLDYM